MKTKKQILHNLAVVILLTSLLFGAVGIRPATAATVLVPGDIAIVGFTQAGSNFAFVLLVDIEAGTQITFTDAGWTTLGAFHNAEGAVVYTAPLDLLAGTVISYLEYPADFAVLNEGPFTNPGLAFTTSGDQILAFQGTYSSPTFIYALNNDETGWTPTVNTAQTTTLPPGLTDGLTAISLGDARRNGAYTGTLSGTREELLAAISNPDNWAYTDGPVTIPTGPFLVDPASPDVVSTTPEANAVDVLRDAQITIVFDEDVELEEGWYEIECSLSGSHTATVSGGPQEYTLELDEPFGLDDACTVTIYAEGVTDFDDPPKNMQADYSWSFSVLSADDLDVGFTSNSPQILGMTAEFSNTTTGEEPITYEWDFGDGSAPSTDESPTHEYMGRGDYDVTLTATNAHGSDSITHTFVVLPVPFIGVDKEVEPETDVPLGGEVTYTITIENTSDETAHGVELSDSLPVGVSYVEQLGDPTLNVMGNNLSWTGEVLAGQSLEFRFTAQVDEDTSLYSETITNTAYVTSLIAGSDASSAEFTVEASPPALSIDKSVDAVGTVALGELVTYTITLVNNGQSDAQDVSLEDALPAGLSIGELVGISDAVIDEGTNTLTWTGVVPGEDEVVIQFTATVDEDHDLYGSVIENTAAFEWTTASGSDAAFFTVEPSPPALSIEKSVDAVGTVAFGEEVTYTITLLNNGQTDAEDVSLIDILPTGLSIGELVGDSEGEIDEALNTLTWTGVVPVDDEVIFQFTATMDVLLDLYGAEIVNTATFEWGTTSGSDAAAFTVEASPPALSINKSVDAVGTVALGEEVIYTITLSNSGQTDAENVLLEDALPAGLSIGELVGDGEAVIDEATNTLTWTGVVPANDEVDIQFKATVNDDPELYGTEIENTAAFEWATAFGYDGATLMVEPSPALLTITKSVTAGLDVRPGEQVIYMITLTNSGDTPASHVVMTDVLPVSLTVLSVQGGGTATGNTVSWTGSIAAHGSKTISFTASLSNSSSLFGQSVSNTAAFTSGNAGQGQASASFEVAEMPKIYLPVTIAR